MSDRSQRRRSLLWWLALCSPLVVPWVVVWTTSATLVFPWGMVTVEGWYVITLPAYLETAVGMPPSLEWWPLGTLCYAFALVWAAAERIGADRRVTAGLLALAAACSLPVASGLAIEPNRTAIPLGVVHFLLLATWAYVR
ncbi:hypothetical protein GCM10025298_18400 [Natronobiforma cellulositropha]